MPRMSKKRKYELSFYLNDLLVLVIILIHHYLLKYINH